MTKYRRGVAALAVSVTAFALGACGESSTVDDGGAAGNEIDRAFVAEMVPHHKSAVQMAEVARNRAGHHEVRQLAGEIIESQNAEIGRMRDRERDLETAGVETGDLGLEHDAMGMDMDAAMLADAEPFDREFIDTMIPHHQGAIRMARVVLAEGESPDVAELAEGIIDAQAKEIDDMNSWRVDWYGELSPAGGVPDEDDPHSSH